MSRQLPRLAVLVLVLAVVAPAAAQGTLGQEKQILPMIKASWVAFRNYDGRQWIYFTTLIAYHCGLAEIRYSIGSDALDRRFPVPACDRQRPNAIDPAKDPPYLTMAPGSAGEIAVQLVYTDGAVSPAERFVPCDSPGDDACAVLVAAGDATPGPRPAAPIPPSRSRSSGPGQSTRDSQ